MTYFISGHRDITEEEFDINYKPQIALLMCEAVCGQFTSRFIVGDCEGVDKMAVKFMVQILKGISQLEPGACKVVIYHLGDSYQFQDLIKDCDMITLKGGFEDDIQRDKAMTHDSDVDIAFIRPGKVNSGTEQNIQRRHRMILP